MAVFELGNSRTLMDLSSSRYSGYSALPMSGDVSDESISISSSNDSGYASAMSGDVSGERISIASSNDVGYASSTPQRSSMGKRANIPLRGAEQNFPLSSFGPRHRKRLPEPQFVCLYSGCGRKYARAEYLQRHMRVHSPAERQDCPEHGCGRVGRYGFFRKDHLLQHLRDRHFRDIPMRSSASSQGPDRKQRQSIPSISSGRLAELGSYNADAYDKSKAEEPLISSQSVRGPIWKSVSRRWQGDRYINAISIMSDPMRLYGANVNGDFVYMHSFSTIPLLHLEGATADYLKQNHRLADLMTVARKQKLVTFDEYVKTITRLQRSSIALGTEFIFQRMLSAARSPAGRPYVDSQECGQYANVKPECARLQGIKEIPEASVHVIKPSTMGLEARDLQTPTTEEKIGSELPQVTIGRTPGKHETMRPNPNEPLLSSFPQSQIVFDAHPTIPPYWSLVVRLLDFRLELRIGSGTDRPFWEFYISFRGEPPLAKGKQRIRWRCRCGRHLFDDFIELRPGALKDLELQLRKHNERDRNGGNGRNAYLQEFVSSLASAAKNLILSNGTGSQRGSQSPSLPVHRFNSSVQDPRDQTSASSETLFLLLCIPHCKYATRLIQMKVSDVGSDQHLFTRLKSEYYTMRGPWISIFSLKKLEQIKFVKFVLHPKELVDIDETSEIIPPETKKDEYRYSPIPADKIPPVGQNHMMHLYEHPEDADESALCLQRIPKKLREQLKVCPQRRTGLGWGIHFVEGFHWTKFWIMGLLGLIACISFGVFWSTFRHDVQGGFGVAASMMVCLTFTTGVVQAALDPK